MRITLWCDSCNITCPVNTNHNNLTNHTITFNCLTTLSQVQGRRNSYGLFVAEMVMNSTLHWTALISVRNVQVQTASRVTPYVCCLTWLLSFVCFVLRSFYPCSERLFERDKNAILELFMSEIALFIAKLRENCFQSDDKGYKFLSDYKLGDLFEDASLQGPVVQRVINAIHSWINCSPVDKCLQN